MPIVIIRQDDKIEEWKSGLRKQAPHAQIYSYSEELPKEEIDMALVWKHPQGILADYPNIKCIASSGAGVDFIFDDPEVPQGIPITRVVDPMLASDMSEFVIAQIFGHLKNLHRYKIDQIVKKWNPRNYLRISDVTVGIMGMGALGSDLAENLVDIGFKVVGWASSPKSIKKVEVYTGQLQKSEFLSKSDILVCLLPLTQATSGILNTSLFNKLPKGAYLINVARGGHLVDDQLLKALDRGHLSGASLDVFHKEPLAKDHPFWEHPKIHMTPHIASVSDIESVVPQILENYVRLREGKPLKNVVSAKKGY